MKTNEKVLTIFMEKVEQINGQLALIQEYTDEHMNTELDTVNWGDVGTAEKVVSDLDNILAFLGLKTA